MAVASPRPTMILIAIYDTITINYPVGRGLAPAATSIRSKRPSLRKRAKQIIFLYGNDIGRVL